MSAQDKLGLGMLMFLVFFVIAFLLVPREVYQEYLASLKVRARGRIVAALAVVVFALSLPYFYETLVGFDNRGIALLVQILIGAAAICADRCNALRLQDLLATGIGEAAKKVARGSA
jgi:hypothetical protein